MNENSDFEENFKEICTSDIIALLKKENTPNMKGHFLNLEINVKHREFETELFDKKSGLHFAIPRMIYPGNNMPTRIFMQQLGQGFKAL